MYIFLTTQIGTIKFYIYDNCIQFLTPVFFSVQIRDKYTVMISGSDTYITLMALWRLLFHDLSSIRQRWDQYSRRREAVDASGERICSTEIATGGDDATTTFVGQNLAVFRRNFATFPVLLSPICVHHSMVLNCLHMTVHYWYQNVLSHFVVLCCYYHI